MPPADHVRHQCVMREDAQTAMPSACTVAPLELMHRPYDNPCGQSVGDELQEASRTRHPSQSRPLHGCGEGLTFFLSVGIAGFIDGQQNIALLLARAYRPVVPKIFEKDGFQFAFYSNDHRPIHVHVRKDGGEAIFDVEKRVELRESAGMKVRDLARAEELAKDNRKLIIEAWHEHLG